MFYYRTGEKMKTSLIFLAMFAVTQATSVTLSADDVAAFLNAHNEVRAGLQLPPVVSSSTLVLLFVAIERIHWLKQFYCTQLLILLKHLYFCCFTTYPSTETLLLLFLYMS